MHLFMFLFSYLMLVLCNLCFFVLVIYCTDSVCVVLIYLFNCLFIYSLHGFYRASYASAVLAVVVCPSVRLSVCLSVTSRYCIETATHRITQTTPYGSPGNLVF